MLDALIPPAAVRAWLPFAWQVLACPFQHLCFGPVTTLYPCVFQSRKFDISASPRRAAGLVSAARICDRRNGVSGVGFRRRWSCVFPCTTIRCSPRILEPVHDG